MDRISFLHAKLDDGHALVVSMLPNIDTGKLKVKVLVRPRGLMLSPLIKSSMQSFLDSLQQLSDGKCIVDRGHLRSDGTHEICFWAAECQPAAEPVMHVRSGAPIVAIPSSACLPLTHPAAAVIAPDVSLRGSMPGCIATPQCRQQSP